MWPLPMVRKPTKKLICCAHPYFSLSAPLIFLVLLEMYVKGVSVKSYEINKLDIP